MKIHCPLRLLRGRFTPVLNVDSIYAENGEILIFCHTDMEDNSSVSYIYITRIGILEI